MIYDATGGIRTGGTLTVNAPAGVTVVLSTDGVTAKYTKTANGDGVAVFKGVSSGTWYVAIIDGDQYAYKAVTVTTDYATTITFFSATIKVTYPAGSTAHIEGPNGYYAQSPDTSGYWEVTVPAAGDYLVCADDSTTGQGVYKTVSITEDGQSVDVTLSYDLSLTSDYFNAGLIFSGTNNSDKVVRKVSYTTKAIDLTNYTTLSATLFANAGSIYTTLAVSATTSKDNAVASTGIAGPGSGARSIDISSLSGEYYIVLEVACSVSSTTETGGAKDIMLT